MRPDRGRHGSRAFSGPLVPRLVRDTRHSKFSGAGAGASTAGLYRRVQFRISARWFRRSALSAPPGLERGRRLRGRRGQRRRRCRRWVLRWTRHGQESVRVLAREGGRCRRRHLVRAARPRLAGNGRTFGRFGTTRRSALPARRIGRACTTSRACSPPPRFPRSRQRSAHPDRTGAQIVVYTQVKPDVDTTEP